MADAPKKPQATGSGSFPSNWNKMTPAQKLEWRKANQQNVPAPRPVAAPKTYPPSMGTLPPQPAPQEQPQDEQPQTMESHEEGNTTLGGGTRVTITLPGCEPVETDLLGLVPTLLRELASYYEYNVHTG